MIYYLLINSLTDSDSWKRVYKELRSNRLKTEWSSDGDYCDIVPCLDGFLSEDKANLRGFGMDIGELVSRVPNHHHTVEDHTVEVIHPATYVNTLQFQDNAAKKFETYNKTHDYMKFKLMDIYNSTESEMGESTKYKFTLKLEVYFHSIFTEIMRTHHVGINHRINTVIKKILV